MKIEQRIAQITEETSPSICMNVTLVEEGEAVCIRVKGSKPWQERVFVLKNGQLMEAMIGTPASNAAQCLGLCSREARGEIYHAPGCPNLKVTP